jgi:hypothetical protein
LNLLLAGRDTAASLLGWLFLRLSKDPARYKKLRDIVIEEFGTYDKPTGITFSKLKDCWYLQHCNNEALRLHPAVPVNARTANKDTTIPRGGGVDGKSPIFIPKGMSVDYSVHVVVSNSVICFLQSSCRACEHYAVFYGQELQFQAYAFQFELFKEKTY